MFVRPLQFEGESLFVSGILITQVSKDRLKSLVLFRALSLKNNMDKGFVLFTLLQESVNMVQTKSQCIVKFTGFWIRFDFIFIDNAGNKNKIAIFNERIY